MHIEKNVFSLKTTVVCLTASLSFPKNYLTTVKNHSLKQTIPSREISMSEPSSRENYYPLKLPTELYLAVIQRMAKTQLSKGDCLIDMLTETAYREGLLPEEHYNFLKAKYGTKTVLEKVLENREKKEGFVRVEVNDAKFEVCKSTVEVKKTFIDYSKFSDEQLLSKYARAKLGNDVVALNMIQAEANRRGYKLVFDDGTGKVNIINLRGSKMNDEDLTEKYRGINQ
ncbi:MAG: hypothetical protein QW667_07825 [Candidatus Bathyarchaeia archaeon]